MTTVALLDDHPLVTSSLAAALAGRGWETSVVEPTEDDVVGRLSAADVAIIDLDLGTDLAGNELVAPLREAGTAVIVVTGSLDEATHGLCLMHGATTVLSKALSFGELLAGIVDAIEHSTGLPRTEHERLVSLALDQGQAERRSRDVLGSLTAQEQKVLQSMMDGLQAAEIGETHFIAVSTVRTHIRAILSKFGVSSQLAAVSLAHRHGWRPDDGVIDR